MIKGVKLIIPAASFNFGLSVSQVKQIEAVVNKKVAEYLKQNKLSKKKNLDNVEWVVAIDVNMLLNIEDKSKEKAIQNKGGA